MRWRLLLAFVIVGCSSTFTTGAADSGSGTHDGPNATDVPASTCAQPAADLLFVIANSNSRDNQAVLAREFPVLLEGLMNPPRDSVTGLPRYVAARSLHVAVISSDLGTPGSVVFSCHDSDLGDDGLLNPIRQGPAARYWQPWTTAPPGIRPSRCTTDPNQYPTFLTFTADVTDAAGFAEDFICNEFAAGGDCDIEQPLESVYRALRVHDPRARAGNTDPNAGFVRDDAVLAIVIVSHREDASTRDCRYAERDTAGRPMPCTDATGVFDSTSADWASISLGLRFYLYEPGSPQDPTWPIDRYVDPTHLLRGYLGLKPGHPEWVIFAALAGVPLDLPMAGERVDWDTLLGRNPDGSDGLTAMSAEGPISMRQRNPDPACPGTRVVPGCRREGSAYDVAHPCDFNTQYVGFPARRVAAVARVFDERWNNGLLSSSCHNSYASFLRELAPRIARNFCPTGR